MVRSQQANKLNVREMGMLHRMSGHAEQVMIVKACIREEVGLGVWHV